MDRREKYKLKYPDRVKATKQKSNKKYREKMGNVLKEKKKIWRDNNKPIVMNTRLKYYYGIGYNDYNNLFNKQNGCCAICGKHQSELNRKLSVDHNHNTGVVRGLLCRNCNSAIGLLKEDVNIINNALKYINK